jgi:predicted enzyme related to lactoylglutathione lyase
MVRLVAPIMFADASPAGVDCDATCHDPKKPNPSTVQFLVYVEDADATVATSAARGGGVYSPPGSLGKPRRSSSREICSLSVLACCCTASSAR